jgi:hypothetical protein
MRETTVTIIEFLDTVASGGAPIGLYVLAVAGMAGLGSALYYAPYHE